MQLDRPLNEDRNTGCARAGRSSHLLSTCGPQTRAANPTSLYAAALEQTAWADNLGFTDVQLMEHHASTDGYLPSPIVLGSAVAGVTSQLAIRLCLVLLPLYDPLRIAEDLAVLDLISGGRLRLTVGLGYRREEYEQFGVDMRRRPSLMEEAVETLKLAWTGEPFDFRGRRVRVLRGRRNARGPRSPWAVHRPPAPNGLHVLPMPTIRRSEALRDLPRRALGLGKDSVCRGRKRRVHL